MSESSPRWHQSRTVQLTIGLLVTAGCLAWAFYEMCREDPPAVVLRQIGSAFASANYLTLIPMLIALAIFYWLKTWRWQMLLRPLGHFSVPSLFGPVMIGFAFNNLLPAHLGEFVRVFVASRDQKLPMPAVLSSVVLERVFDVLAILAFLGLGLSFVPGMDPDVQNQAITVAIVAAAGVLSVVAFVLWTGPFVRLTERILELMPFVPDRLRDKLTGMLESGAAGLSAIKNVRLLLGIVATSLIQWALNGLLVYLSLRAFGIEISPLVACIVLGVVAFGVTVPSSPGYFGVIQLCFLMVLKLFTDDTREVFAASIYYHMAQYIPVTLIGLYYFNKSGLSVREVEREAEHEEETLEELGHAALEHAHESEDREAVPQDDR
ncbi:hypothetical protein Mal4_04970 [Maioricimonas rarisocia]|uniref:Flippase-like domain-containing protein n=1 Tax=Maioricimonas rarisocia TaxID=2528026 RepID=A0A517Z169_9PLAN|nr:lysylphosphatidylglycerol synthase transmembrane domain-containing protein [Maioricimonas rarisocia]QDU36213.1 hypothetical protein Mal4_04970 [Maioricimonas rarisocia]